MLESMSMSESIPVGMNALHRVSRGGLAAGEHGPLLRHDRLRMRFDRGLDGVTGERSDGAGGMRLDGRHAVDLSQEDSVRLLGS